MSNRSTCKPIFFYVQFTFLYLRKLLYDLIGSIQLKSPNHVCRVKYWNFFLIFWELLIQLIHIKFTSSYTMHKPIEWVFGYWFVYWLLQQRFLQPIITYSFCKYFFQNSTIILFITFKLLSLSMSNLNLKKKNEALLL